MSDLDAVKVDDLNELRERLRGAPDASKLNPIGLQEIVRGPGAVRSLASVLARCEVDRDAPLCVLSDSTPKSYLDRDVLEVVLESLEGREVKVVELTCEPLGLVHANEATLARAKSDVARSAAVALVSIGSGTAVDIGKYIARELSLTHVVVQTAASVNGFADDQSVLLIDGVKRTTPSQWPRALVIDPLVVADAPLAMTRSGLGDQLSMFSAAADWYLASAVGFDTSFSPTTVDMMRREADPLWPYATDLGRGDHEAVDLLASSLAVGGIAMGVAGRTAPSSGTEHVISHLLEMYAGATGSPSASHGSTVGVASVVATLLWQRVRERLSSNLVEVDPTRIANHDRVLEAFARLDATGAAAEECWSVYQRKATWMRGHLDEINRVLHDWSAHDAQIENLLVAPSLVAHSLERAKAPARFGDLDPAPDADVVTWALKNCHLMRDRFTVVDLADLAGAWSDDDVAALLRDYERILDA